ncbi:LysM peptidoglycan-binding domain-containing protein [Novosphingobium panipatense]
MPLPQPCGVAESETTHVVVSGETLNGIANRAGVSASAISKANGLREPYVVRVGQRLAIPRAAAPARPSAAKPADEALPAAAQAARTASRVIAARLGPTRSPETATEHLVQPGETLGGIAARAKVPRILIAEANGLQPPYAVRTGQTLRIPVRDATPSRPAIRASAFPWTMACRGNRSLWPTTWNRRRR